MAFWCRQQIRFPFLGLPGNQGRKKNPVDLKVPSGERLSSGLLVSQRHQGEAMQAPINRSEGEMTPFTGDSRLLNRQGLESALREVM